MFINNIYNSNLPVSCVGLRAITLTTVYNTFDAVFSSSEQLKTIPFETNYKFGFSSIYTQVIQL